jgi:hypothetical protein
MGCIAALENHVPQAHHFHCACHWHQNIIKTCGGSVSMPGNALWTYNLLVRCKTLAAINHHSEQQLPGLFPTNHHYLSKLPNEVQYPAARCAMGEEVFMYGLSASSGSESMNRANMPVRSVPAVDALNASILMLRLESKRHNQF